MVSINVENFSIFGDFSHASQLGVLTISDLQFLMNSPMKNPQATNLVFDNQLEAEIQGYRPGQKGLLFLVCAQQPLHIHRSCHEWPESLAVIQSKGRGETL